ncbi:MAG: hypothetical protein LC749_20030 [Actinobacteria bacterium]|nr:hypothetical protein [Actinomycetota bacterium]
MRSWDSHNVSDSSDRYRACAGNWIVDPSGHSREEGEESGSDVGSAGGVDTGRYHDSHAAVARHGRTTGAKPCSTRSKVSPDEYLQMNGTTG